MGFNQHQGSTIHVQAPQLTVFSEKIAGWPLGNSQGRIWRIVLQAYPMLLPKQ
jgi:lipopolysaccharide export system protein LptC